MGTVLAGLAVRMALETKRLEGEAYLRLPLAGEVVALEERGGWGKSFREPEHPLCGNTPTPALPRKRERE
jgi:hypothetical protein